MKKLLISGVTLLLLLASAWGEEDKPILNETFEKCGIGQEPTGWNVVKGANSTVEVVEFKGSKSLHVKMSPNEVAGISKAIDSLEKGIFTVEYDLYPVSYTHLTLPTKA